MKKIFSANASSLIISVLFLAFAITSCKKQIAKNPSTPVIEELTVAKAKPNTLPTISLRVTVRNAPGDKITSDGGGDYINGSENMKVEFDQYGNFMFSGASSNPKIPIPRFLNYNFNDPSPLTPNPPITGTQTGNFISTGQTATSPNNTPLQNLAINATKCIGFSAGINIEGGVVNFHRNAGTEDTPTTPTAYVYVTRISSTQWVMTPVPPFTGGCSTISNVAALRVNGALYGYYNMPFSFTLTAQ